MAHQNMPGTCWHQAQHAHIEREGIQHERYMHSDDMDSNADMPDRDGSKSRNTELHSRYNSEANKDLITPQEEIMNITGNDVRKQ